MTDWMDLVVRRQNAIFAVDGSPVIHDVFVGLDNLVTPRCKILVNNFTYSIWKRCWFSVLHVTNPEKPYHLFSVFNDRVNNLVKVAGKDGDIETYQYTQGSFNVNESLEALKAAANQQKAKDTDISNDNSGNDFIERDKIATCQSNSTAGKFLIEAQMLALEEHHLHFL